jgi:replicative DNA helicase
MSQLNLDLYEKVIVYNCLKSGNEEYLSSVIDHLDADLFKDRSAATIVQLIRDFYVEHNKIPNRTEIKSKITNALLATAFKKMLEEFKLMDTEYTAGELIKNTETFIKQRAMLKSIEASFEEYAVNKEIDEIRTLKDFDKIQSISLIDNLGMDFVGDSDKFIEKLSQKESYISTGYTWLDREFNGGLYKEGKAMYAFAGETNVGKSIVLGNIAANVFLQSYNVVIVSLEMSEFRYAKRIASMLSGISQIDLVNKKDDYAEFINRTSKSNTGRLFIKEFPTKQVSAKHIAGYLKKLERKRNFKPDLIILDYHTLLKPSIPQGSKHADMQFITQESRALTYVFECPLVSAAQLNRSDGNVTGPDLNRIAGSWDMLSDLDYLVNIWQTDEDREAELIRWEIKKGRDSEKNVKHFWNIDYSTLRLKDEDSNSNSLVYSQEDVMSDLVNSLGL